MILGKPGLWAPWRSPAEDVVLGLLPLVSRSLEHCICVRLHQMALDLAESCCLPWLTCCGWLQRRRRRPLCDNNCGGRLKMTDLDLAAERYNDLPLASASRRLLAVAEDVNTPQRGIDIPDLPLELPQSITAGSGDVRSPGTQCRKCFVAP